MSKLKNTLITAGIIIGVISLALAVIYIQSKDTDIPSEEFVKCLGESSVLYVNSGCPHCKIQKKKFGDTLEFLTIVDCTVDMDKCIKEGIIHVPTWVFEEISLRGVQTIGQLKNITWCDDE